VSQRYKILRYHLASWVYSYNAAYLITYMTEVKAIQGTENGSNLHEMMYTKIVMYGHVLNIITSLVMLKSLYTWAIIEYW
jgi:hypothetical protein